MRESMEVSKTFSATGSLGLFLLRLIPFAMLIAFHGMGKLLGAYSYLFEGQDWGMIGAVEKLGFPYAPYFAIGAALAETLFSFLLIVGLFTRFSAAVVTFNFIVAAYNHLISDWKFEMAALYLAPAIALVLLGPGRFSLDAVIRRKRMEAREHPDEELVPSERKVERIEFPEHSKESEVKPEPPL